MFRPFFALLLLTIPAQADTALAAVAANFAGAATELATAYKADTGHDVQITTGSTGKLYAQITQGAPFDLLLSADASTPERLAAEGHGPAFPYAFGVLTLWAPGMAPDRDPTVTLQDVAVRHIAIANPELAPYGAATIAALKAMGFYNAIAGKIVMGQNIGQAFAMVESGAAEAGFIARSALPADAKGLIWNVSPDLYPAIRQDAILLQHGNDNPAAKGFLSYLVTPAAQAIIARYGYALP
ncbi:molybdate ABC transporter substrate-binding protein [Pseudorhodobacter sp.]|uniref:molybdate ABC transporter substrate-binding protein n=1 Tax=Pseudorhodobacter sp. TaxID=1934400 RepID=UPI00264A2D17|nr:molybdate ABC transporter substrate-binding protein [Pseudorhodobacter sp.]MDN5787385.1 molybdate ABC transporter substrate-binding protein [Pseudorhodobacter sp.]